MKLLPFWTLQFDCPLRGQQCQDSLQLVGIEIFFSVKVQESCTFAANLSSGQFTAIRKIL